jgi:hypothetical protein
MGFINEFSLTDFSVFILILMIHVHAAANRHDFIPLNVRV